MGVTIFRPGQRLVIPSPGVQVWSPRAASASGAFLPSHLANLTLWLDGADLATMWQNLAKTTPVTAPGQDAQVWRDKSAAARDFVYGNGPATYQTDGLDFVSDSYISVAMSNFITVSAGTIFIAAKSRSNSTGATVYQRRGLFCDSGGYLGLFSGNSNTIEAYNYDGSEDIGSAAITLGNRYIVSWLHGSGNMVLNVGGSDVTVASGNTGALTGLLILGRGTTTQYFDGVISEIVIYSRSLSGAEMTQIRSYLTTKWTLTWPSPATMRNGCC